MGRLGRFAGTDIYGRSSTSSRHRPPLLQCETTHLLTETASVYGAGHLTENLSGLSP